MYAQRFLAELNIEGKEKQQRHKERKGIFTTIEISIIEIDKVLSIFNIQKHSIISEHM